MIEQWIATYGYPAVLVGTFLEGETIVVIAGFAAHRGYLALPQVIAAAFAGTLAGDQLFFHLGRTRSEALLGRHPSWRRRVERVRLVLERHQLSLVLGFRFLYGLRTVTPFAIGMSGFSSARFLVLNAVGAAVWATVIATLGYLFGHSLELLLGDQLRVNSRHRRGVGLVSTINPPGWGCPITRIPAPEFLRERRLPLRPPDGGSRSPPTDPSRPAESPRGASSVVRERGRSEWQGNRSSWRRSKPPESPQSSG